LEAAKKAAKKLKIMYKDVLNLFEKYLITKDENLFVSKENYKVDINSFDKYLDVGNWTHPYIDLKKISVHQIINENVWDYYKRIKKVKKEELEKSEKNYDKIADEKQKLLDFLFYIKEAHKLGREKKDFYGAIDKLEKAVKLMPKRIEGRWGLASANFYVGNIEKAKKLFEKLCSDFGDRNPRMFFEYGVILLNYDIQEGIKYIKKAMDFNNEFDYFFKELGNLYGQMGNYKMAKDAYLKYKESYPDDYTVDCYLDK
jgi:tetratricopeptide (TPR) repeat protein